MGYNIVTGVYTLRGEGKDLYLTIDANLNEAAYKALDGRKGAVGVMNYKTGDIICMVSSPTFDPLNTPDFENTGEQYEGVFLNRFISSAYTPGSTFKLITLAAAIENIPDLYDRAFTCGGSLNIGATLSNALKRETVHRRRSGRILQQRVRAARSGTRSRKARFVRRKSRTDKSSAIEGIMTAAGNLTGPKKSNKLALVGIGQYNDTVCPANMLRFVGAIANGGVAVDMSLIQERGLAALIPPGSHRLLSKQTADKIATMLNYNVYKSYGEKKFAGLEIYAKSGTAEVVGGLQTHAWFVGYITNKDNPLAFASSLKRRLRQQNGGRRSE